MNGWTTVMVQKSSVRAFIFEYHKKIMSSIVGMYLINKYYLEYYNTQMIFIEPWSFPRFIRRHIVCHTQSFERTKSVFNNTKRTSYHLIRSFEIAGELDIRNTLGTIAIIKHLGLGLVLNPLSHIILECVYETSSVFGFDR